MTTKHKPTAKAEATPKAKRTKTPPPTLADAWTAVAERRLAMNQFAGLIVELDHYNKGILVPANDSEFLKRNAQHRRSAKASIRRANKVIARYAKAHKA